MPLPKVKAVSEAEAFKVVKTGKTRRKGWKRMVTKVTFVGETFTRKPAKFERFIRPMGLRFNKVIVLNSSCNIPFSNCYLSRCGFILKRFCFSVVFIKLFFTHCQSSKLNSHMEFVLNL